MTRRSSTLVIAHQDPPQFAQEPVALPIVQSTTFYMDSAIEASMAEGNYRGGWLYTRMDNPTLDTLARRVASLHGAEAGLCTASGMGALSAALFGLTQPGDVLIVDTQLYGVTDSLLDRYLVPAGRRVVRVPLATPGALEAALEAHAPVAWVLAETVSNPLLQVLPVAAVARACARAGARLLVDNTFANPLLCAPLALGASLVVESLSKSMAGHSDVHGGAVVGSRADVDRAWDAMIHLGPCLDPHAAAMIWRGMKTLALRASAAAANTRALAERLRAHPRVTRVYQACPVQRPEVAETLRDTCPMVSFVVEGGDAAAERLLRSLSVVAPATSLGGVESLVSLPMNTSHRTPQARERTGLLPGTLRLSVGCEDVEDLWVDIDTALRGEEAPAR